MRIKNIRIENFRSFNDQLIIIDRYSCFVGGNGAGKSNILAALNVFFQDKSSSTTDVSKLIEEDYFNKNTSKPIRITITFTELNEEAKNELSAYVRQDEITVTAEAAFNSALGFGQVHHYGQRLGMQDFRHVFEAEKAGAKAGDIAKLYEELQKIYNLPSAKAKDEKLLALQAYESQHPTECALIPSEDEFYGINGAGKLSKFIQWVYVPAVKDAVEEGQEAKNTSLGKLIARAVRTKTNFENDLESLKQETLEKYKSLLTVNQASLTEISNTLQKRLESWSHPNVKLGMEWVSDPSRSISIQQPLVGIKTGEGDFLGNLARMGHGLQRSYLLALLQELANADAPDAPTLILGCEEPELYQHPPQARHLSDTFEQLTNNDANNQILVTTHSPTFVSGDRFENLKLVSKLSESDGSSVASLKIDGLCASIRAARGEDITRSNTGLIAKIHQALQPNIAEMFFTKIPILVEGLEDASYITTHLHLIGRWDEFRRLGCHLIPTHGKDKLIQPLAIAKELGIPVFIVFDSDGDTKKPDNLRKHELDNGILIKLLDREYDSFPTENIIFENHAIWPTNMADSVKADFGDDCDRFINQIRNSFANEGGLEKNNFFIADWLTHANSEGKSSITLTNLCDAIISHARRV